MDSLKPQLYGFIADLHTDLTGISEHLALSLFDEYSRVKTAEKEGLIIYYKGGKEEEYPLSDHILVRFDGKTLFVLFNNVITYDYAGSEDMRGWDHMDEMRYLAKIANLNFSKIELSLYDKLQSKKFKINEYTPHIVNVEIKVVDEDSEITTEYEDFSSLQLRTSLEFNMMN